MKNKSYYKYVDFFLQDYFHYICRNFHAHSSWKHVSAFQLLHTSFALFDFLVLRSMRMLRNLDRETSRNIFWRIGWALYRDHVLMTSWGIWFRGKFKLIQLSTAKFSARIFSMIKNEITITDVPAIENRIKRIIVGDLSVYSDG